MISTLYFDIDDQPRPEAFLHSNLMCPPMQCLYGMIHLLKFGTSNFLAPFRYFSARVVISGVDARAHGLDVSYK